MLYLDFFVKYFEMDKKISSKLKWLIKNDLGY